MDLDRAAGPRRFTLDEAFDELLDASIRHRMLPLARGLAVPAEGVMTDEKPAIAAARYRWGLLLETEVVAS